MDSPLAACLVQRDRNRCRGGISVSIEVDYDFFHGYPKPVRQRLDDPAIRLMRNHQRNFVDAYAGLAQSLAADLFHGADCNLEDFFAVHRDGVLLGLDRLYVRGSERTAGWNIQRLDVRPIGAQTSAEHAPLTVARCADHHRSGTIAKKYTS